MRQFLRIFIIYLAFAVNSGAVAQALPSANRYGQALSRLISNKAGSRGFAANDPRYGATTIATGAVATAIGAVAGGVIGGATAPAWVTVAAGAVIATIAGTLIDIGIDAGAKWIFGSDGKITVPARPPGPGTIPTVQGGGWYEIGGGDTYAAGADPAAVLSRNFSASDAQGGNRIHAVIGCSGTGSAVLCTYSIADRATGQILSQATTNIPYHPSGAPSSCSGVITSTGCIAAPTQPSGNPTVGTISDAAATLTPAQLGSPASLDLLAGAANELWRQAALSPGYQGLPYDAADPITAQDVQHMLAADPASYPHVADAIEAMPTANPTPNPYSSTTPITTTTPGQSGQTTTTTVLQPGANGAPSTTTVTTTTTNNFNLDLGPNPGIGSPTLEDTPTIAAILGPLLNLMPELRGFQVPSHQSTCPTIAIIGTKYGDINDNTMCRSVEEKRSLISALAVIIWAWVAFRVFMR
jgi:hypothetical protein